MNPWWVDLSGFVIGAGMGVAILVVLSWRASRPRKQAEDTRRTDETNRRRVIQQAAVLAGITRPGRSLSDVDCQFARLPLDAIAEPLAIRFEDLTGAGIAYLAALLAQKLMPLYPVRPKVGDEPVQRG